MSAFLSDHWMIRQRLYLRGSRDLCFSPLKGWIGETRRLAGGRSQGLPPFVADQDYVRSAPLTSDQARAAAQYVAKDQEPTKCGAENSCYWMTSSATVRSCGGNVTPNIFAVFSLRTNSNLVGCSTGKSLGFAPLRILST